MEYNNNFNLEFFILSYVTLALITKKNIKILEKPEAT